MERQRGAVGKGVEAWRAGGGGVWSALSPTYAGRLMRELLLRVPGLGARAVDKIIVARRQTRLGMTELGMLLMTKFKFSLTPLLILDAELVRLTLTPFVDSVIRQDNLILVGDYSGVILWGCTGVRSACLLVISYRLALIISGSATPFRYRTGLLLMLASFLINHVRLTLSAHSQALYEFTHTPHGMMLFDSLQVMLLIAFLLYANGQKSRPPHEQPA